jgi:activator of HSP90 ATPase
LLVTTATLETATAHTMALHNPNNWHYVDKNVQEETEQYFKDQFVGLHAEEGDVTAKVSEVQKLPKAEDVYIHVSQKRGKLWALFMFTLEINFTGSAPDAEEVTGTITVGEIDWSMETDEYKVRLLAPMS